MNRNFRSESHAPIDALFLTGLVCLSLIELAFSVVQPPVANVPRGTPQRQKQDEPNVDWPELEQRFGLEPLGSVFFKPGFGSNPSPTDGAEQQLRNVNAKWEAAVMSLGHTEVEAKRLIAARLDQYLSDAQLAAKNIDWLRLRQDYQLVDITRVAFSGPQTVRSNTQPWLEAIMSLGYSKVLSQWIIQMRRQNVQMEILKRNTPNPPVWQLPESASTDPRGTDSIPTVNPFETNLGTVSTGELTSIADPQLKYLFTIQPADWLIFDFNGLDSISDQQAAAFGKLYGSQLNLNGLRSITDTQAASLAEFKQNAQEKTLSLDGLTVLTERQAESLAKFQGTLSLNGLTSLSDTQAEAFGKYKGIVGQQNQGFGRSEMLLNGLNSINDHQAASLGKINDLALDGLTSISPEQLKHLTNNGFDLVHQRYNSTGAYLKLNGLTGFEDRHAEILSRSISRTTIQLNGLKSLTEKQAVLIGTLKLTLGGTLHLAGLLSLSDEQTEHLSSIPGLYLDGLTSISNAQAKSLSQLGGEYRAVLLKPNRLILPISVPTPYLSLDGLHSINETQARYLTSGLTGLSLGGLKSLTQTQAALLSRMKGLYVPYDLQPMIDESRTPDEKQKSHTDQD